MSAVSSQRLDPTTGRTPGSWRIMATVFGALLLLAVVLRLIDPARFAWASNFLLVFNALLIEATPFILLGALVSAAIEVFMGPRAFATLGRIPRSLQLPAAALAGMAFPVCECGSVPVARRLAAKGLAPGAAVTFMLAAPVANPVVIASTYVAYKGRDNLWFMVLGRVGLGIVVAMCAGWVIGRVAKVDLLRPRPDDELEADHEEDTVRWKSYFGHVGNDFVFMGRFLILGAAVAAAVQTFIPQSVISPVANTPVVSQLAMMGLAYILSLCSESDAFVAASFVQFGASSQLAFLVFGPMVDTKLTALYMGTYNKGFFRTILIVVTAVTLVGTVWLGVFFG
jgi:uncharacterized membrane protein YraQ (UPF0718 family)